MGKRGLGRGLGALLPGSLGGDDGRLREVSVNQIHPSSYQPRQVFDESSLNELAQSIEEHGILQPVILKRTGFDSYELVAGERRFRAAKRAGLNSIPAIVREFSPNQMLEVALIENLQREDINAVDAARAYQRLREEFGLTQEVIARRVGKSQSSIANTLRLLSLPSQVLESVQSGEITEGHGRAILLARPEAQHQVWTDARNRRLSVRETEKAARAVSAPSTPSTRGRRRIASGSPGADPNISAAEEALTLALGVKVRIRWTGVAGQVVIDFYSDDDLNALIQRLVGD